MECVFPAPHTHTPDALLEQPGGAGTPRSEHQHSYWRNALALPAVIRRRGDANQRARLLSGGRRRGAGGRGLTEQQQVEEEEAGGLSLSYLLVDRRWVEEIDDEECDTVLCKNIQFYS